MIINGVVVSGTRKGSYFLSQKFYSDRFREVLGFKPYPGTLNIKVNGIDLENIISITESELDIIHGSEGFGDVKYIEASLNSRIDGALVLPVKTEHPTEILEFIAKNNIREELNLSDGDSVNLNLKKY